MVHRKSTYRMMYKNYTSAARRNVWQENNDIREQRKQQEQSHQSIQESDSDCECDELDEESSQEDIYSLTRIRPKQEEQNCSSRPKSAMKIYNPKFKPDTSIKENSQSDPPVVPRLRFSPELTPRRHSFDNTLDESDNNFIIDDLNTNSRHNSRDDLHKIPLFLNNSQHNKPSHIENKKSSLKHLEYDLIPAAALRKQEVVQHTSQSTPKKKKGILRSKKYPMTTKLSKTTLRSHYDNNRSPPYVPYGIAGSVRNIGDKTSYNVYLNDDQVHSSALNAKAKRQQEIDQLVKAQRKMSLEDWEKRTGLPSHINHTSLFASDRQQIFSKTRHPRMRTTSAPARVRICCNFCKHCGCRK